MKGIIAEINQRNMIVLTEKGDFIKQKTVPGLSIGDELLLKPVGSKALIKQFSALAATLIIFAMLFTGVYAYCTPTSYISVDINPSIGLSINRFERVIEVQAFNEGGQQIITAAHKLVNKQLAQAVSLLLDTAHTEGYLKDEQENSVMFVVSADNKNKEQQLAAEVNQISAEQLSKLSDSYNIVTEKVEVSQYKQAAQENVSPGKAVLTHKLKEADPEIKLEDVQEMSVKEAMDKLKEKKDHKTEKKQESSDTDSQKQDNKKNNASDNKDDNKNKKDNKQSNHEKINNKDTKSQEKSDNSNKNEDSQHDSSDKHSNKDNNKESKNKNYKQDNHTKTNSSHNSKDSYKKDKEK